MKRLLLLAGLLSFVSPAFAAGTIPFSLSQQLDSLGKPLAGCQLYTIQAGTTSTPQSAYQDSALTIALPNPQTCDAAGRLPQMFLADGTIKVRLTDRNGVSQVVADNIQVIGASSGGGGGGTVDPTTIMQTGHIELFYGTGVLTGFVRANGRTIGSATSGATERVNLDTQALFQYLWVADANLAVSGGRGVSAAADWAANKTITLPDSRGRTLAGLDDMGNSAASRLTSSWFGATATTLGAVGGNEKNALSATNQLPQFTPSGSIDKSLLTGSVLARDCCAAGSGVPGQVTIGNNTQSSVSPVPVTFGGSLSFNGAVIGSASPSSFALVQPTILTTIYIKL